MSTLFDSLGDKQLAVLLQKGAVGVLPTDTVYGLVCAAVNAQAVQRLYKLKNRQHKPGTLIAANIDQLVGLGFKRRYLTAVEQFWPGPVSVEIPFSEPSRAYITQGQPTIGVRIPAGKDITKLLSKTGPLQTTSANPTGKEIADTIHQAQSYFGDKVDFYVNGGDLKDHPPSTLIRIVDDAIEVLRQGAGNVTPNS